MNSLAPIVLFAYNRPEHLARTLASLRQNPLAARSELFVFADGPRRAEDRVAVGAVHDLLARTTGFARTEIVDRETNWGLANSVIAGVSDVMARYGRAIVLEDDLIFAPDFLNFMNDALRAYARQPRIFSVSGYTYPLVFPPSFRHDVCLLPRASSWGWATWADRWAKADWAVPTFEALRQSPRNCRAFAQGGDDLLPMLVRQQRGEIDSWAIRWGYTHFLQRAYGLYPVRSKVANVGHDHSGTHTPARRRYAVSVRAASYRLPPQVPADPRVIAQLRRFFRPSRVRRVINAVRYGI